MLVKLYALPPLDVVLDAQRAAGVIIRRARAYELSRVCDFVRTHFSASWADEAHASVAQHPMSLYIAIEAGEIIGFAAYECTARAFFGPTGVLESKRGSGVGKALLIAALHGLKELGYGYGIIGGVGPAEFYAKAVGATLIEGSTPGMYGDPLKKT